MDAQAFEQKQQAKALEGWMILEIFGHQRFAGYVSVENLGIAAMVRLDVPELAERERTTKRGEYIGGSYCPPGTKVKEGAVQGYTKLFGVGAIYAMTPCTKEACLAAVEEVQPRPMTPIELPAGAKALAAAAESADDDADDDDGPADDDDYTF